VLYAWRGDVESAREAAAAVARDADLSRAFALGMRREAFITVSGACFLRFIARYDRVVTDRLHVAIGGALLGRDVTLAANRYFKNRAVYEHSLRDRFPRLRWGDESRSSVAGGSPI
jgi:exopolysaccharide biosynthesis predicted pyruvyltransferase EpsI